MSLKFSVAASSAIHSSVPIRDDTVVITPVVSCLSLWVSVQTEILNLQERQAGGWRFNILCLVRAVWDGPRIKVLLQLCCRICRDAPLGLREQLRWV